MEVLLPPFLETNVRQTTNQPGFRLTEQQMDMLGHREVTLPIIATLFMSNYRQSCNFSNIGILKLKIKNLKKCGVLIVKF